MVDTTHEALTILTWPDARKNIRKSLPALAEIIDDIDPGPEYTLLKASYPFGEPIIQNGAFYLPNTNRLSVPVTDHSLNTNIYKSISYSSVPLGLIIKKCHRNFL